MNLCENCNQPIIWFRSDTHESDDRWIHYSVSDTPCESPSPVAKSS